MKTKHTFTSIDSQQLTKVSGGAARVAANSSGGTDQQLQLMLTQIGDSIKDVANNKNSSGNDQLMPMMMMMMMMGGGGGGSAPAPAAPPPPNPTYVRVNVRR